MTNDEEGLPLTARQREIVVMVCNGMTGKEIARALGISRKTVETHRASAMLRSGARSTALLVRYAIRKGIVT